MSAPGRSKGEHRQAAPAATPVGALLTLAARSAWNRRFVLGLVVVSIALATFLLLGIERLRADVRQNFSQAVSGTDLVVGARTGPVQLLLYAVFRIGNASNSMRTSSLQVLERHPQVAWVVPLSLGDSHRGFPVLGTLPSYFEHFRHGQKQPLVLAQGRGFAAGREAVLGADVAERLGYGLGARLVLSHGDGALAENDHTDQPFTVVGVLARTGTPVDRTVHISLQSMEALHQDPLTALGLATPQAEPLPRSITAALVGLKRRSAVFAVQRDVASFRDEPLMAILPGVTLDELWDVVGLAERGLQAISALVAVVSLAGLVAVVMAGLNERRRELAILRAVGAGPRQVLALLALEGTLVTAAGVLAGAALATLAVLVLGPWVQGQFGITLQRRPPGSAEWQLLAAVLAGGVLASLVPGWRAYRLSLADGLSPRT